MALCGFFFCPISYHSSRLYTLYRALQPPYNAHFSTGYRPKNTPIIKRRKFFLILLQTCFPTGYKRRTAQQQAPHDKTPPHNSDTGTRHNNKRRKNSKRKFSKLVTNAVPHGVTTERRTTAAATSSTAPDKTERMPRTGKSSESYNALDDVGPKEIMGRWCRESPPT